MRPFKRHYKLVALAAACAAIGAAVSAIATAGAATPASGTTPTASSAAAQPRRLGLARRAFSRAVQGSLVVRTNSGFATVTFDRGVVNSVSGDKLAMTERTKKAVYKTVTLTIPSNANVRVNRQKSSLAQVKPGQRVLVLNTPSRTVVVAWG
jgi:hypothetical protein